MTYFFAIILLTGAVTLSLELLASRIMTPYFGVSLYIWSGILSITLIALALGYWWGGRLCRGVTKQRREQLVFYFGLMPAVSCNGLVVACLLYPKVFLPIAKFHLVFGSFFACVILLFIPLVCLSAMNPILVALRGLEMKKPEGGDAGAGLVFFISTLGSVAGVLATAFVLIPNLTNFRSVLLLAFLLSVLATWSVATTQIGRRRRRQVLQLACGGAVLILLLFVGSDWYLKKSREIDTGGQTWKLLDEVPTFFGNIKVVQMSNESAKQEPDGSNNLVSEKVNIYLTDASVQGTADEQGRSRSAYIYVLESIGRGIVPQPRRILMLGLGTGSLPTRFARDQIEIDVVEINPIAAQLAEEYFHFDPSTANVIEGDARVYVRHSEKEYDLIFFDLFQADCSTPEYLLTVEFMRDLSARLSPHGAVLFNVVLSPNAASYFAILKTISTSLPELRAFHRNSHNVTNIMVIASHRNLVDLRPSPLSNVPLRLHQPIREMLRSQRKINPVALSAAAILTDDNNVYSFMNGRDLLLGREQLIARFPPEFLVN